MSYKAWYVLAENIKALIKRDRLSQRSFANAIGIDPSTLSKFFKGERELQLEHLDRISDQCGCQTYELFVPGAVRATERRRSDRRTTSERRVGVKGRLRLASEVDTAGRMERPHEESLVISSVHGSARSPLTVRRLLEIITPVLAAEFAKEENARRQALRAEKTAAGTSRSRRDARGRLPKPTGK
jgi:transcriptional regulator with XRE-family HTH domain